MTRVAIRSAQGLSSTYLMPSVNLYSVSDSSGYTASTELVNSVNDSCGYTVSTDLELVINIFNAVSQSIQC